MQYTGVHRQPECVAYDGVLFDGDAKPGYGIDSLVMGGVGAPGDSLLIEKRGEPCVGLSAFPLRQ